MRLVEEVTEQVGDVFGAINPFNLRFASTNDSDLLAKDEHGHQSFGLFPLQVEGLLELFERNVGVGVFSLLA